MKWYRYVSSETQGNIFYDLVFQSQQITPTAKLQVLQQFDKAISSSLAQRAKNKVTFKVGYLEGIRQLFIVQSLNGCL